MPLFQSAIPVNNEKIAAILNDRWGLKLGKIIKASQNHTFQASDETGNKFAVRVTPDPDQRHMQRVNDELIFVQFCTDNKLHHVCGTVMPKQSEKPYIRDDNLIICVFQWAHGEPVNFFALTWLSDQPLIRTWGRYLAQLHQLSRKFQAENPEVAKRIQNWNEIHHGVMKDVELDEADQKDVNNPKFYGVVHGDLNTSNCFYHRQQDYLSVYDSDQTQRGFYEWDLAQGIFGAVMLKECGMPISGDPVPQADPKPFMEMMVKGYEEVAGEGSINRERLQRMIALKRLFYLKFCTQAVEEGNIPKDMQPFIQFVVKGLGKK